MIALDELMPPRLICQNGLTARKPDAPAVWTVAKEDTGWRVRFGGRLIATARTKQGALRIAASFGNPPPRERYEVLPWSAV